MITEVARIISFLSNPIFVLSPVPYLLLYRVSNDNLFSLKWTVFSLVFLVAIALFTLYAVSKGIFSDFDISKREQRPILFLFIGFITLFYLFSLALLQGPLTLYITVLGTMFGVFLVSLINTKVKVSLHVATITSVILTLGLLYSVNYFLFLLIPVTAWSRIRIKKHTPREAAVGAIVGIVLTLCMYVLLRYVLSLDLP